jgi:hypothetical protein
MGNCFVKRFEYLSFERIIHSFAFVNEGIND